MNKYVKPCIMLAILVAVTISADYLSSLRFGDDAVSIFAPRPIPFDQISNTTSSFPGDIEFFYRLQTVFSSINAVLLVFLMGTYIDMYRKLKSGFTIGLILFSLTLLLYALTSNPLLRWLFGFQAFGLGPFVMLPDLFTTVALGVMLYIALK